jgi:3-methyladenine DNA glycosylase AlkD
VDASAPYIVGPYLIDRSKTLLHRLIKSKHIWDRRIALVATWPMIRAGNIDDTLKLAAQVLDDSEDLIHKATGWMLREVGKKDTAALRAFLRKHYARLPRTTLRFAIERFSKAERQRWLKGPIT